MPKRGRKDLMEHGRKDLTDFVESVAPTVESTIHEMSKKAPPMLEKGQKMAKKKRRQLEGSLADHLPEQMVERLPIESPHRKRRKLRALLVIGGIGAAAAVVVRKVMDQRSTSGWQSAYDPPSTTPPGVPTAGPATDAAAPPTAAAADDRGAASIGEAMADQGEHPRPDSTPDDPAYVEELDTTTPSGEPRPGL